MRSAEANLGLLAFWTGNLRSAELSSFSWVSRRAEPAAGLGGIGGAVLGGTVTAVFGASRDWPFALPLWVLAGAAAATILVGAIAGAYPAARAARMSPTEALATV